MSKKEKPLRVVDLFCGAGGISAGLEMAGMEVIFGLDNNKDSIETFQANHPNAEAFCGDALSFDYNTIPPFDMLVGGPPCVNFSTSKGGRANVLDGLRLVHTFLRLVHERNPKYWIMENVPRVALHLPGEIPLRWIGIDADGFLNVPVRAEFNCADYGVPQTRKRYLIGNFPIPIPTHAANVDDDLFARTRLKKHRNIRDVLEALPSYGTRPGGTVEDPSYGVRVEAENLAHYHDVDLAPDEAERIRNVKLEHPYMGRMAFPDSWDRPARTIVATQLGRETIVFRGSMKGRNKGFRRPTIAECALLQTFPLCFQFFGPTANSRYRQVGNAVPPLLAFRIGCDILKKIGVSVDRPRPFEGSAIAPSPIVTLKRSNSNPKPMPATKNYKRLVPGKEVRGTRAQLENRFEGDAVSWRTILYVGEGKANMRKAVLYSEELKRALTEKESLDSRVSGCTEELSSRVQNWIDEHLELTSAKLQEHYINRATVETTPDRIVEWIKETIEIILPKKAFEDYKVSIDRLMPGGPTNGIRIRVAGAGFLCSRITEQLNRRPAQSSV
jgi:DNA (cytosine-5)-methyltransferase 1